MMAAPPRFGVVGWKNAGKTVMTARLVGELTRRGYRVATIKRAHGAFDIDHEGTDTHAHRLAGASEVAIVSQKRWALMHENEGDEPEATLDSIVDRLSPCDLVLIEGFKAQPHPKLEMRLADNATAPLLADRDMTVVALAFDTVPDDAAAFAHPVFQRDQIGAIAQLIETRCGLTAPTRRPAAR